MILKLFYIIIILLAVELVIFFIKFARDRFYKTIQKRIDKLIEEGKLESAKEKIYILAKKIPRDAHLHYSLAYLYWKENKIDEMIGELKYTLKLNKKFALANFLLGYINFYNLGRKTDAIYYLEQAIKSDKKLIFAYNTFAVIYMSMNEFEKATGMFKKVMEHAKPEKDKKIISNAYNNLGILEIKRGNYESAIDNFKKAQNFQPDNVDAMINLGNIYGIRLDYSLAYECFNRAEKIQNNNKFIKYWIGCLHYLEGEFTKSIEKLSDAISIDNEFAYAYLQKAYVYKKLGKEEEFKINYERAILLNPQIK